MRKFKSSFIIGGINKDVRSCVVRHLIAKLADSTLPHVGLNQIPKDSRVQVIKICLFLVSSIYGADLRIIHAEIIRISDNQKRF